MVIFSFFRAQDKLAYLSVISGDVKVSDGITEIEAKNGDLTARNMRTLVKTGQGIASLRLQDGSLIIIDEASTVEFNRYDDNDPRKSFALNLVKGRLLVINENGSQAPTQLLIGGDVAVRISDAVMGLEINLDDEVRKRVDCLIGQCLVNGYYLLLPGQNAQIKPGGTALFIGGIPYETWISLGRASEPNPALSVMLANIFPTITTLPTYTPKPSSTPRPSFTPTQIYTQITALTPTETMTLIASTPTPSLTMTPTPFIVYETNTPIPPTYVPPYPTNVPPSATNIPPSQTSIPPSQTSIPPSPTYIPPTPTRSQPIVIESCEVNPSSVPIGLNVTITFIIHFSSRTPGYGFDASINPIYPGQSGCSGVDSDGDGMAYCDGSSGELPELTTIFVTLSSPVGNCDVSYSSR